MDAFLNSILGLIFQTKICVNLRKSRHGYWSWPPHLNPPGRSNIWWSWTTLQHLWQLQQQQLPPQLLQLQQHQRSLQHEQTSKPNAFMIWFDNLKVFEQISKWIKSKKKYAIYRNILHLNIFIHINKWVDLPKYVLWLWAST